MKYDDTTLQRWRTFARLVSPLVFVLVLTACSGMTAPPPATVRPTAPVPVSFPTSTEQPMVLPTAAKNETNTPIGTGALVTSLAKMRGVQTFSFAMTINVKEGASPAFALDLKGQVDKGDAHYTYPLGSESVEFIEAGGKFYAKGSRTIGLPTATKWYSLSPDLADVARPPFSPEDVLGDFLAQPPGGFAPAGSESLDGQNCSSFRAAPQALAGTGVASVLGLDPDTGAFSALDSTQVRVWVCDDGMLHQLSVEIAAHNLRQANEQGTAKLLLHIWDISSPSLKIDPPANAEPFQVATPTRK